MRRIATKVLLAIGAMWALAGCLPESELPPESDTRTGQLGILCDADLSITGSFVEQVAKPVDVSGCWPVGTWTFTVGVKENRCTDHTPVLETQYSFKVSHDASGNEVYEYLNDPTYEHMRIKVTSGGGGLCEGGLLIFSQDGKTVWNLKPALYADFRLDGQGEYELYGSDQR